ncbi:LysR family transcriptional regulator ArgP [Coralloluteibacterium thermophilus]|uniref:LysR family transcriptional regulator ArgP n=1 Tax=Coralloluteibacterium thermophilum TaxID=2707049 RepID=A0ABV9NJ01_9GAMM
MDHAQLKALAAVVREGSFEKAAAALHVTPSAISQRIKALENRIGRLLLQRGTPTVATPDGQILVQLAEQTALLEHDALERLGVQDEARTHASISVAVNHDSLATWFLDAMVLFAARTTATLDLQSEDQDHTISLLRQGAVLAAVTARDEPVQGCRIHPLGSMAYAPTCSPAFHERYFSRGVNAASLAQAPVLVFNRKDAMQARFVRKIIGDAPWNPPVWWLPSARAFVRAALAGLGWTMNPLPLVQDHLDRGELVVLRTRMREEAPLFWQHWRMRSALMDQLTDAVLEAAARFTRSARRG